MRIAVISARYGEDIGGGAETLARGFLQELARLGHTSEVWTTCALDNQTWQNHYSPGSEYINGVNVQRFLVDSWERAPFERLSSKMITQGGLSESEQADWVAYGPSSRSLFAHTRQNQNKFDLVIAIPVVSPLVFKAAWLARERLMVWPCLHDEVFAYTQPVRLLMESAKGILFNAPEEQDLALNRLKLNLTHTAVIGSGVDMNWNGEEIAESDPDYLLYVGRLEAGKNLPLLIEYTSRYVDEGGHIRLKIAGRGSYHFPDHPAFVLQGFVDEQKKGDLYGRALALCQPSLNESFSLTMMESWLAGRPALVHKNCRVTRGHVQRARGGLWFETFGEFRGSINWLRENPALAGRMGKNGRSYVRQNYTWPIVAQRFLTTIEKWQRGG